MNEEFFSAELNAEMNGYRSIIERQPVRALSSARIPRIEESIASFAPRAFTSPQRVRYEFVGGLEGDFEDTIFVDDEDTFDVVIDSPFAFTIVWAEFDFVTPDATLNLLWGPQGVGASVVDFDDGTPVFVDGTTTRHTCDQSVPYLGYVQINTIDIPAGVGGGTGTLHYKIHYTRSP